MVEMRDNGKELNKREMELDFMYFVRLALVH